jgi:hypothetical protein
MNVEHYTPIHFSKKQPQLNQIISSHFEPLLLSIVVLTGIIGSIYLFGQQIGLGENSKTTIQQSNPQPLSSLSTLLLNNDEEDSTNAFDKYVKLDGKLTAGQNFEFEFIGDEKASRYVMEMGDGVRLIVTQKHLMYNYESPGKYTIELKEIKSGLLLLLGTKTVKVK